MGRADYLELGDYNALCYQCGGKFKARELQQHWQGHWVCRKCWEPRHPQDFVKAAPPETPPPWTQPPPDPTYVYVCTLEGQSAIPALGTAGCLIPSRTFTYRDSLTFSFCTISSVLSRAGEGAAGCATVGRL